MQKAASLTQKVKSGEKGERKREKLKQLLRERESVMDWTNILHTYCSIYFLILCLRGAVAYHCPHCSCPYEATVWQVGPHHRSNALGHVQPCLLF
jgi:hypothetical protein